jgi:MATE family multidrug resistance protein
LNKRILRLAIPNIISNISIPLLGSVDTALVGHLGAVYYLGAIAVGAMIFNFIYWGFGFLRMGTTGLTAQAYGEHDESESMLTLGRALVVALSGGALLIILQVPVAWLAFKIIAASADVETGARVYFFVRIWAAPATLSLYALQGWFLGMQNARYPMIVVVFVNLTNIVLDILFVRVFGMNVNGVALGTVLSAYSGLALALVLFWKRYRGMMPKLNLRGIFNLAPLKRFVVVNRDIMIRTLLLVFAYSFFTAKSAELGDMTVAVNSILMQFWMIMAYGVDGFAFAAEALVGRYTGAKDEQNLRRSVRYSFYWGLGLGAAYALFYYILDRQLLEIFTDDSEVISLAMSLYYWILIAPFVNSVCFIWDGVFIGATATRPMVISMILATIVIFLPTYYLGVGALGNDALWLAMTLFMATRGIALSFFARRSIFGPKWINSSTLATSD